ncbi:MAG: D-alanine--D-alanine ligase [Proteobacteria bacterium]|nr:D-alanine--D-alanine ligase [Pseudomonadota bacterium]
MSHSHARRVTVLYNTDYDDELIAAVDESAVRQSAMAITQAARDHGFASQLVGVHGHDLGRVMASLQRDPPDLVFNLCESLSGDARNEIVIPAVLDMLGLLYTGTGALELGLCLHKERTKDVLAARAIATPAYCLIESAAHLVELRRAGAFDRLNYPYFLKLAHEDASIGITAGNCVQDAEALLVRAGELLAKYRQPVIAERYIAGREINVTLLGNDPARGGDSTLEILPLHEIDFAAMPADRPHIVSYAAKWDENHVEFAGTRPVPICDMAPEIESAVRDTAMRAFSALAMRDFGRVDLRVDRDGCVWVIDVNPNCDLSPDAGVARAASVAGMSYAALIGRICEIAWRRGEYSHHFSQ